MSYNISSQKMKKAIEKCNGTKISLARHLKVKSLITAYRHLEVLSEKNPELMEEFNKKKEDLLDHAEDKLFDNLSSSNPLVSQRCAEFILKNLAGSRFLNVDAAEESVQAKLVSLIAKMVENTD